MASTPTKLISAGPRLPQLLQERASIESEIQALQTSERSAALSQIKSIVAQHGISAHDLLSAIADTLPPTRQRRNGADQAVDRSRALKKHPLTGVKAPIKYRNRKTGDTWSGRGLRPRWLQAELSAGRSLEHFAV